MKKNAIILRTVLDITFLVILSSISLLLISFYFQANMLDTGYADWLVHAFRIKSLQTYGLVSWTHEWDNGMNIWRSYQFIPHFLTLGLVELFHVSVTRAMILIIIIQFVLLRVFIYIVLRLLHIAPFASFVCALLSFDIAQYWGGVSDFSLLFGFTFFPLMLFFWVKYYEGKLSYFFPYIAGILFYIHPLLGFTTIALWVIALLFSERKIVSLSSFFQFLIILISSSLFWFPIVSKSSYTYTASFFSTSTFLHEILAPYSYYGLSLFLLLCLGMCSLHVFMPISKKLGWTKVLFVFSCIYFLLVILGLSINLPAFVDQFQFTRGVTFIGIGIIFVVAPIIEKLFTYKPLVIKGVLLFLLGLVLVEGIWFTSIYSPQPVKDLPEVTSTYTQKHAISFAETSVWSSTIDTSSYYAPLTTKFPYSYMNHLESNQLSPRLESLILSQHSLDTVPNVSIDRLGYYFKLSGTKYLFFDETSPYMNSLLNYATEPYKNLGQIDTPDALYHGFEVPWQVRNAAIISDKYKSDLRHFPFALDLSNVNDQISLDSYVKKYTNIVYAADNTPLIVTYPGPETLQVAIPKDRKSNTVYIGESFDSGWKAYINNQPVSLASSGPNFIIAKLPNLQESGILVLKHSWPVSFYISVFFIMIIPIEIIILRGISFFFKKEEKKLFI